MNFGIFAYAKMRERTALANFECFVSSVACSQTTWAGLDVESYCSGRGFFAQHGAADSVLSVFIPLYLQSPQAILT